VTKKGFEPSQTRTIAVVGHRSAGKTSLGDLLLQAAGATRAVGRVEDGTSLLDHTAEARRRRQTLEPTSAWVTWRDHLLFLLDTPGSQDLGQDVELALRMTDGFLLVVAANDGVGHVTRRVLGQADHDAIPGIAVFQQADRPHDLDGLVRQLSRSTSRKVLPLQLTFEDDDGRFAGIIDVVHQRALRYDPDGTGAFSVEPLPVRVQAVAAAAWERVVEAVALEDEALLERYLEFLELPAEDVLEGLARGVREARLLPVLVTSAMAVVGAEPLLDALVDLLPAPTLRLPLGLPDDDRLSASVVHTTIDAEGRPWTLLRVWTGDIGRGGTWINGRTGAPSKVRKSFQVRGPRRATAHTLGAGALVGTWDFVDARPGDVLVDGERVSVPTAALPPIMVTRLLVPRSEGDIERLDRALPVLLRMDHAIEVRREALTGEWLLDGRTLGQLQRAAGWLRERMGVAVQLELPRVAYREAPLAGTWAVEGTHRREVQGLVEEYGHCALTLAPDAECNENAYETRCDEEEVPRRFHGAITEGARQAALEGPLAGYPVIGARVTCVGGEYDILCSAEEHFREAGAAAMRAALQEAGTRLLEPWVELTVHAPAEGVGAVLQDLTGHRGRILDVRVGAEAEVSASCPERETRDLAARLSALTGGRGWFSQRRTHYDVLPDALVSEALRFAPRPRTDSAPVARRASR
jgi:elongation factor G